MSGVATIQTIFHFLEQGRVEEVRPLIAGDFVLVGWTSQPLTKNQFLDLIQALKVSMPDLRFQAHAFKEDSQLPQSDRVAAEIQLMGTQTAPFVLAPYNIPPSSQSPRLFTLPRELVSFTVMGDTLASMTIFPARAEMEHAITRLTASDEEEASAWIQPSARSWTPASPEEASALYDKQSNLYDPHRRRFPPPSQQEPPPAR